MFLHGHLLGKAPARPGLSLSAGTEQGGTRVADAVVERFISRARWALASNPELLALACESLPRVAGGCPPRAGMRAGVRDPRLACFMLWDSIGGFWGVLLISLQITRSPN